MAHGTGWCVRVPRESHHHHLPSSEDRLLRRLFQDVPQVLRARLLLDDVAKYSVTDQRTADAISRRLLRWVSPDSTVVNATACVGGNTLSMARHFARVLAIERNLTRFRYLVHNLRTLDVRNVDVLHADSLAALTSTSSTAQQQQQQQPQVSPSHDLIFIDPPWGGPGYKLKPRLMLYLSGVPLYNVCGMLAPHARYIALKVPVNFDLATFTERLPATLKVVDHDRGLRNMHVLVLGPNDLV